MKSHTIFSGKVHLCKRDNSRFWQCSSYLAGRNRRTSTKQESLQLAREFAEDWYLTLRGRSRHGELPTGKTFAQAAKAFEEEYEAIARGRRSPKRVQGHKDRIRLHLMPYFGKMYVNEITSGAIQKYRVHRMTEPKQTGKSDPASEQLHDFVLFMANTGLRPGARHL